MSYASENIIDNSKDLYNPHIENLNSSIQVIYFCDI